ncbi:MAG: SEL1-like repeat protein, partial [Myxococcales bacterium]|nr:SEL1-like repeat protein [Myxococcales bacterium]
LILDWRSDERGSLETLMNDGVATVKYDCNSIKIVQGCMAKGKYGFIGVRKKEDSLQLANADEIRANLPTLGASISAEMTQGSALDIAYITVGKMRTLMPSLARSELKSPSCAEATHFIRGVYVGAFAIKDGKAGQISAAAEVFGYGASGKTQSSKLKQTRDGDAATCSGWDPSRGAPPGGCGSLLRLELVRIGADASATEVERAECPEGLALIDDKCTFPQGNTSHTCDPASPEECKQQCEKGSAASCGFYAYALQYGYHGVKKDLTNVAAMYKQACDRGDMFSCSGLGILYGKGQGGLKEDRKRSNDLHRKACDAGVARGCLNLGVAYEKGFDLSMDKARSVALYRRACDGGLPVGCLNLGISYQYGNGVTIDTGRAKELYEVSCETSAETCGLLANLYYDGIEVAQDYGQAAALFRKACTSARSERSDEACRRLGWMYIVGKGVAKDVSAGIKHLTTACEDGHGPSCNAWASLYDKGEHVPKSELSAAAIHEKACERGVGDACSSLGYAYELGKGVAKDRNRAVKFYRRSCELESGVGCHNVAKTSASQYSKEYERLMEASCSYGYANGCYELGVAQWRHKKPEAIATIEDACNRDPSRACTWLAWNHPDPAKRASFAEYGCGKDVIDACYMAGRLQRATSPVRAAVSYDKACVGKHAGACVELAALYEKTPELASGDRAAALRKQTCFIEAEARSAFYNCRAEWAEELCDARVESCVQYAWKIAQGTHGQQKDPKLALKLWRKGCDGKNSNGCWGLADAYEKGWGVTRSKATARKYVKQAAEYGATPVDVEKRLQALK